MKKKRIRKPNPDYSSPYRQDGLSPYLTSGNVVKKRKEERKVRRLTGFRTKNDTSTP